MKIPESIRVNGREIKIERPDYVHMDGRVCYGKAKFSEGIIEISKNDAEHQHQCVTMWHELCHFFCQGIYQVLQDNGMKLFDMKEGESK